MVDIFKPIPCILIFAVCLDDSKPNFAPENWIKKDRVYRVTGWANALNCDETSLLLSDKNHKTIEPNAQFKGFKSNRFHLFKIILN